MTDLRTAAQQAHDRAKWINDEQAIVSYEDMMDLRAALEQQEQEPVAWIQPDHLQKARVAPFLCRVEPTKRMADFVPIYTTPPRREWQGLTDEERGRVYYEAPAIQGVDYIPHGFAIAVEAALKEKNHE